MLWIALAGFVFAGLLVWTYASPYWALYQLHKAAVSGDVETLKETVDFPSFRASLKEELGAQLSKKAMKDAKNEDGFAAIGSLLAGGLVNAIIDQYVTPQNLVTLLQGKKVEGTPEGLEQVVDRFTTTTSSSNAAPEAEARVESGYESFSRFAIRLYPPKSKLAVSLMLYRAGLFGWRLSAIRIPDLEELAKSSEPPAPVVQARTTAAPAPPAEPAAPPVKTPEVQVYIAPEAQETLQAAGLTDKVIGDNVQAWLARQHIGVVAENAVLEGMEDWVSVRFTVKPSSPATPLLVEISVRNGASANNQLIRWQGHSAIPAPKRPEELIAAVDELMKGLAAAYNTAEYKAGQMNDRQTE